MSKLVLIILLLITITKLNAQQQPVLSQYMMNNYHLNPAHTGEGELYNLSFLHRAQWSGYRDYTGEKGAPITQLFTAMINIDSTGHGFGLMLSQDKTGLLTTFNAEISYAYRVQVTEKSTLAMGIRGGLASRSVDQGEYIIKHPNDPYIGEGKQRESKPDFTVGLWLNHEKYYAGVSAKGLVVRSDYETLGVKNEQDFIITTGYHFRLSNSLKLTPSVQVITNTAHTSVQGGMMLLYENFLWGGLYYRHEESATALAGFSFLEKKFRIGYAFDYITDDKELKTGTSNELMLSYRLGKLHAKKQ